MRLPPRVSAIAFAVLLVFVLPVPAGAAHAPQAYILAPTGSLQHNGVVTLAYNSTEPTATLVGELFLNNVTIANYTRDPLPAGNSTFNVTLNVTANLSAGWTTLRATFDNGNETLEDARLVYYSGTPQPPPTVLITSPTWVLHTHDNVGLSYTGSGTTVQAWVYLDGIRISQVTEANGTPGTNLTWSAPVHVPGQFTSGWRTLTAVFDDGASFAQDSRPIYYQADALPPLDVKINASYVVGMGFRITGSTNLPNGTLTNVSVLTEYGETHLGPQHVTFNVSVPAFPTHLGAHTVTVTVRDTLGRIAYASATVNVQGAVVTIYDRNATTTFGAYADAIHVSLPDRIIDGRVYVNMTTLAGTIEGVVDADDTTIGCGRVAMVSSLCAFTTRDGPGTADFAWVQTGPGDVRLTIVGLRL